MNLTAMGLAALALLGAVIPVVHLYGNRVKPGALWLLALCVVLAIYPLDVFFISGEAGLQYRFSTVALAPPIYLLVVLSYLGLQHDSLGRLKMGLYLYMVGVSLAPWLPGDFYLSFPAEQPYQSSGQYFFNLEPGAWIAKAGSYLCVLVAAWIAIQQLSSFRLARNYLLPLALAPVIAMLADLIMVFTRVASYSGVTAEQIPITLGLFALSYALLRQDMLARVQVSNDGLIRPLREGICVLSDTGEIVDCNDELGAIIGVSSGKLLGRTANHVLPESLLFQIDQQRSEGEVTEASTFLEDTQRSVNVLVEELGESETGSSVLLTVTDTDRTGLATQNAPSTVTASPETNERLLGSLNTDPLTRLGSRRLLRDTLARRAAEQDTNSGLVVVDVDYFKALNDTHGHEVGDTVLVRLAEAIRETLRDSDLIVRWGDKEFVVLLHESDTRRLKLAAERLQQHISRLVIELPSGVALQFTVSIGSTLIRPGQSSESALRQVDRLLDEAKMEGRDGLKSNR